MQARIWDEYERVLFTVSLFKKSVNEDSALRRIIRLSCLGRLRA
jgi:hypothetical protein